MKRREFLQSILAAGATPLMARIPIMAAGATMIRPLHKYQSPYSGAAFIARTHDGVTPSLLSDQMGLSNDMAHQVFEVLKNEGVIGLPNPLGVSQAFRRIGGREGQTHYMHLRNKLRRAKQMLLNDEDQIEDDVDTLANQEIDIVEQHA